MGDDLFEAGKYQQAAEQYFQTGRSFEEITLKFLIQQLRDNEDAIDGLETYLMLWLCNLGGESKRQKIIITNWLIEIKVRRHHSYKQKALYAKLSQSASESRKQSVDPYQLERVAMSAEQDLQYLLTDHCKSIPDASVYQIMQSHGRLEDCLTFALQNQSFEMILQHYINEEEYEKALSCLKSIQNKTVFMSLLQKHCQILLAKSAVAAIEVIRSSINQIDKSAFKIEKLIVGLLDIPQKHKETGAVLVKELTEKLSDKTLPNIYILFLSDLDNPGKLANHLQEQADITARTGKFTFDTSFALRLTTFRTQRQAQIIIYGMVELFNEAVETALSQGLIDTAMQFARKSSFRESRAKKLWLSIALHLLRKGGNNIEEVLNIVNSENREIQIEDLLLHFNDNIKIENFKDQVCESLQQYHQEIMEQKETMKQYSESADHLKNDLRMIKNRYIEMPHNLNCSHCFQILFNSSFYIFPCMHGFHQECLIERIEKEGIDSLKINQIKQIHQDLELLQQRSIQAERIKRQQGRSGGSGFFTNLNSMFGAGTRHAQDSSDSVSLISPNEEKELVKQKERLDKMLANECVFCGPAVVDNIYVRYEFNQTSPNELGWDL